MWDNGPSSRIQVFYLVMATIKKLEKFDETESSSFVEMCLKKLQILEWHYFYNIDSAFFLYDGFHFS